MKIYYFSPYDILRPRTNQVGDVRLCEGFKQNNADIRLIVPYIYRKDNIRKSDVAKMYGLENTYPVRYLFTLFFNDAPAAYRFAVISFLNLFIFIEVMFRSWFAKKPIIILSRDAQILRPFLIARNIIPFLSTNIRIVFWVHEVKSKRVYRWVYKKSDALIGTNSSIVNDLIKKVNYSKEKTCVSLNPITEEQLRNRPSKEFAQQQTGLSGLYPLIIYTGKIGIHYNKEILHILEAAKLLPPYHFVLTGGKPDAVAHWQKWCDDNGVSNIKFTGYFADYSKVRYYQFAADVLVSYYTRQGHDPRYNLPNKVCEYMLTGNVMVIPDYPATRDTLDGSNCIFAEPENSKALAEAIRRAAENKDQSKQIAAKALKDVQEITFKKRTAIMIEFLSKL